MKFNKHYLFYFFLLSIFFLITSVDLPAGPRSGLAWRSFSNAGKFITAIAWDKDERLWVAAEEFGVSLIDGRTIKTFDIPYCYSIECDRRGRVWIGSLRQGLYCYEYGELKNFNISDGLPTNSVYAITFDKYDTPYCASGLGLAKLVTDKWEIISLPDDLPRSEISGMDFDKEGNLWVGFSLGGVAKFNGWAWKLYTQEDGLGGDGRVNDVLVAKDGTIWVATCEGINRFQPEKRRWEYIELPQMYDPPNYFLDITEDSSGNIFFANRHETIMKWGKNSSLSRIVSVKHLPDDFVYCVTVDEDGYVWAGMYRGGITTNNPSFKFPARVRPRKISVKKPSASDFLEEPYQKQLISEAHKLLKDTTGGRMACYIGEDWLTRGDWMGRYGEYAWILCAYYHAYDLMGGSDKSEEDAEFKHLTCTPYIGENADPSDMIRGWLHWENTDNPKVLQDPLGGGRRHAEWDDHAESYPHPMIREGPHIYLDLEVPEGTFMVSFYFMNKDAHETHPWNRYRDYTISIEGRAHLGARFENNPILACCRVHDFRAGVYKRFMLKGPRKYTVKFDKNESSNTNLAGVFVDKLENHP